MTPEAVLFQGGKRMTKLKPSVNLFFSFSLTAACNSLHQLVVWYVTSGRVSRWSPKSRDLLFFDITKTFRISPAPRLLDSTLHFYARRYIRRPDCTLTILGTKSVQFPSSALLCAGKYGRFFFLSVGLPYFLPLGRRRRRRHCCRHLEHIHWRLVRK